MAMIYTHTWRAWALELCLAATYLHSGIVHVNGGVARAVSRTDYYTWSERLKRDGQQINVTLGYDITGTHGQAGGAVVPLLLLHLGCPHLCDASVNRVLHALPVPPRPCMACTTVMQLVRWMDRSGHCAGLCIGHAAWPWP